MRQPPNPNKVLLRASVPRRLRAMRIWLASLVTLWLGGAGVALAAQQDAEVISEFVLDNGLKLIVQEDHRAPVAVVQVWYRVGGADEHDGITGVSHALEHMMFKGTESLEPGEFSEIVAARGGRENAFTSADYTAYYQEWGAENVEMSFKLEADRMRNLKLTEETFEQEIKVIAEERRLRTDDNPSAYAYEVLRATAYETGPYRQPVIGWAEDIENMQLADLKAWYQRFYAPNNAIVVVVGDVDPDVVHALAKAYFGQLAAEDIPPPRLRTERTQTGTKRTDVRRADARVPSLMLAFKAPSLPEIARGEVDAEPGETYALDVASAVLAGDGASRMHNALVREQGLATSVYAGYSSVSRLTSLFYMVATPAPGTSLDALEAAMLEHIHALKETPPSEAELARVKAQVIAESVYERDSPSYQANLIGSLEAVGLGWQIKADYADEIANVAPAEVSAAAARFLTPERMTVTRLMPEEDA